MSNQHVAQQSEAALIAGCLQNRDWFEEAGYSLTPQDLAGSLSRPLFQAMIELDSIDVPLVIDRAVEISRKSAEDFSSYLASCFDSRLYTIGDLPSLIQALKSCSTKRQALDYIERQAKEDFLSPEKPELGVARITDQLEAIVADGEVPVDDDEEIRAKAFVRLEGNSDPSKLLPTGIYDLDAMIYPNRKGQLITICARPSHGKSRFMRNLAASFAKQGEMVRVYSLEVPEEKVLLDLAAALSDLPIASSRNPTEEQAQVLVDCLLNSEDLKRIKICETESEEAVIRDIRKYKLRHGCSVFFIDYLQLMVGKFDQEDGVTRISRITRKLKSLARNLGIEIYILAQLNRSCESRQDKRPLPSDLRESGSIEQDSDTILGLYVDEKYNPDTMDRGIGEVLVLKQREGSTGAVRVLIDPEKQILKNIARRSYV